MTPQERVEDFVRSASETLGRECPAGVVLAVFAFDVRAGQEEVIATVASEASRKRVLAYLSLQTRATSKNGILRRALEESVKLQSHYAELLNAHDGGGRQVFPSAAAWLKRLVDTGAV